MSLDELAVDDDEQAYYGGQADPTTGHRSEEYVWRLLDRSGGIIGTLDGVTDGKVEHSIFTTIKGGGSLTFAGDTPPEWDRVQVQPWYRAESTTGQVIEWPLGVFLASSPAADHGDAGITYSVDLYDRLLIPHEDRFGHSYSLPAGTSIVGAIREILDGLGWNPRHVIEDSDSATANPRVWDADATKLRIINDLLESINYGSLYCDGYGIYRAEHYTPPQSRPTMFAFIDSENGIYSPDFTYEHDTFGVPNRVIVQTNGTDEEPGMIATAENIDPASPFSHPARDRWVTDEPEEVEAVDLETLQSIADRRLSEKSQVVTSIEVSHYPLDFDLNGAVTFRRDAQGVNVLAVVQKWSLDTTPGALQKSTIREVVST